MAGWGSGSTPRSTHHTCKSKTTNGLHPRVLRDLPKSLQGYSISFLKDHGDVGRSATTGERQMSQSSSKSQSSHFGPLENHRMSPLGVHLWEHEGEGDQKWTELIYQVQIMPDQTVRLL